MKQTALLCDRACLLALTVEPGMALESLRRSLERRGVPPPHGARTR